MDGVLPVVSKSWAAQVSANKHQVPFSSACFKLRSVELMPHLLLKISSLEFGDVDSTHFGLTTNYWAFDCLKDIDLVKACEGSEKLLVVVSPLSKNKTLVNLRRDIRNDKYHPAASSSMPRCSTLPPRQPHLGCKAHTSSRAWRRIPHVHGKVIAVIAS